MEQFTIEQKMEIHHNALIIFKNVIEAAMQIENSNNETYAYIVSNTSDNDCFFDKDLLFVSLMNQKKIFLKSKVPYHQIYFPLFILAKIINEDIFQIEEHTLIEAYADYLEVNNLLEEDVNYENDLEIINQMTREPGIFWINKSGCTKDRSDYTKIKVEEEEIVFKFDESYIEQYDLQDDGRYIKKFKYPINETYIDIDGKIKRKYKVIYKELEVFPKLSNKERYIKYTKEQTKFSFRKQEMIEYTLQDIYDYINKQLELFESLDKINELNQNLKTELKNPKMVQRLLDSGLSVEEALESIGY